MLVPKRVYINPHHHISPTYIDFPEIRGFPLPQLPLWGPRSCFRSRANLTKSLIGAVLSPTTMWVHLKMRNNELQQGFQNHYSQSFPKTGVIKLPTLKQCTVISKIPQHHRWFALFDPPQNGLYNGLLQDDLKIVLHSGWQKTHQQFNLLTIGTFQTYQVWLAHVSMNFSPVSKKINSHQAPIAATLHRQIS